MDLSVEANVPVMGQSPGDIAALRLRSQRIPGVVDATPAATVGWMGAVQAQDLRGAYWAVGLRGGVDLNTVESAIEQGTIVRTWLLRGTLHLVTLSDVGWILPLLAPRIIASRARRYRQLDLDEETLLRCCDVFAKALEGAGRLTRAEMLTVLEEAGISTAGQRGYHILGFAGLRAVICFGPMQGKQQTFVLLDALGFTSGETPAAEAAAELAHRYFSSHGPATLEDFVWWSGLRVTQARSAIKDAGQRLRTVTVNGQSYWMASIIQELVPERPPSAHFLPAFDEYYLAYRDRSAVLDPAYDSRVVSSNGIFRPMVVIDGQVVGIWRQARNKESVVANLELFREVTSEEKGALEHAANRYAAFLGEPVTLALSL